MNRISPDEVLTTPAGELAALASESLFQLRTTLLIFWLLPRRSSSTSIAHWISSMPTAHTSCAWRQEKTPASSISTTGVPSPPIYPRRSTGTEAARRDHQRIAANGDDPSEYVEISYRISETKFNAWPESIKSAFAPARTLKTGKPGFRLALLQGNRHENQTYAARTAAQAPEMYLRDLPDNIRIPALDGNRPDEIVRCLEDATIDDLAFAIQGMESESRLIHRRLSGLRDLYEMARKRGALGVTTVADAFANISTEEAGT